MGLRRALQQFAWTSKQRSALIVTLIALLVYLFIRAMVNPWYVSNPQPIDPPHAKDLADRIDPNLADPDTLAALPQLGEKRAKLIVEYRNSVRAANPDAPAFEKAEDLLRIKGIGASILEQIRPFLVFPTSKPSTAPAVTQPSR